MTGQSSTPKPREGRAPRNAATTLWMYGLRLQGVSKDHSHSRTDVLYKKHDQDARRGTCMHGERRQHHTVCAPHHEFGIPVFLIASI